MADEALCAYPANAPQLMFAQSIQVEGFLVLSPPSCAIKREFHIADHQHGYTLARALLTVPITAALNRAPSCLRDGILVALGPPDAAIDELLRLISCASTPRARAKTSIGFDANCMWLSRYVMLSARALRHY